MKKFAIIRSWLTNISLHRDLRRGRIKAQIPSPMGLHHMGAQAKVRWASDLTSGILLQDMFACFAASLA